MRKLLSFQVVNHGSEIQVQLTEEIVDSTKAIITIKLNTAKRLKQLLFRSI